MRETTVAVSTAWYLLVFAALGFFVTTFAAIMSHIPRIPQQRGLLAVILVSGLASAFSLMIAIVTQLEGGGGSPATYGVFTILMIVAIAAALLDLFYFVQARRRGLEGANWSLYVALLLAGCGALGLFAQYGVGA